MSLLATLAFIAIARAEIKEVDVKVEGLVCAFCANGLKTTFLKNPAVDTLQISLEKRQVRLFLKSPLTTDEINHLVDDAGFKVEKIDYLTK